MKYCADCGSELRRDVRAGGLGVRYDYRCPKCRINWERIYPHPAAPRRPHLVSPRPHAFGEMGRHLTRISLTVDWPVGGDIDE